MQPITFSSFTNEDAFQVGNIIVNIVKKQQLKPVRIRIVLADDIVFQYLMEGKKGVMWLDRKQKTVETFQCASLEVFTKAKTDPEKFAAYQTAEYAICGGGYPIIVDNQIIGCVIVSGLAHEDDHQLIVDALTQYKQKEEKQQ